MFTGLIEELGSFVNNEGDRYRFAAQTVTQDTKIVAIGDGWWEADVVAETISRTSLGRLQPGDPVNLERAVRSSDRLGGHMVQGHVDGVGTVLEPGPDLRIQIPKNLERYFVEKGSVTVTPRTRRFQ